MKLPRWLIISMLTASSLAALGTAAWWWATWPERVINEYIGALTEGRVDDAIAVCGQHLSEYSEEEKQEWYSDWLRNPERITAARSRAISDYLLGRQRFELTFAEPLRGSHGAETISCDVTVERGKLLDESSANWIQE